MKEEVKEEQKETRDIKDEWPTINAVYTTGFVVIFCFLTLQ